MSARQGKPLRDPRGGHVRLYLEMIVGPAWNSLSATDQRAYVALRCGLGKSNNGDLSLPLSRARHHQITSPSTLAKALRSLVAVGLIAVTRRGGCTRGGQRLPTLYRFTDEQVFAMPGKLIEAFKATNDWKAVQNIPHGLSLIEAAEANAKATNEEKRLLQLPNSTATDFEAVRTKTSSKIEAWNPPPLQKLKHGVSAKTWRIASSGAGLCPVVDPSAPSIPHSKK